MDDEVQTRAGQRTPAAPSVTLRVPVDAVWQVLAGAGGLLAVVSAAWRLARGAGWQSPSSHLDRLLDLDQDVSLVNWTSASVFLLAAVAAVAVAQRRDDRRWPWLVLAVALLFASVDEGAAVHDPATSAAEDLLGAGGLRTAAAALVVLALGALGVRLLAAFEPPVRRRLALSAMLLLAGAIGVDAVGPAEVAAADKLALPYVLKSSLEELLELAAAALALDTALRRARGDDVHV